MASNGSFPTAADAVGRNRRPLPVFDDDDDDDVPELVPTEVTPQGRILPDPEAFEPETRDRKASPMFKPNPDAFTPDPDADADEEPGDAIADAPETVSRPMEVSGYSAHRMHPAVLQPVETVSRSMEVSGNSALKPKVRYAAAAAAAAADDGDEVAIARDDVPAPARAQPQHDINNLVRDMRGMSLEQREYYDDLWYEDQKMYRVRPRPSPTEEDRAEERDPKKAKMGARAAIAAPVSKGIAARLLEDAAKIAKREAKMFANKQLAGLVPDRMGARTKGNGIGKWNAAAAAAADDDDDDDDDENDAVFTAAAEAAAAWDVPPLQPASAKGQQRSTSRTDANVTRRSEARAARRVMHDALLLNPPDSYSMQAAPADDPVVVNPSNIASKAAPDDSDLLASMLADDGSLVDLRDVSADLGQDGIQIATEAVAISDMLAAIGSQPGAEAPVQAPAPAPETPLQTLVRTTTMALAQFAHCTTLELLSLESNPVAMAPTAILRENFGLVVTGLDTVFTSFLGTTTAHMQAYTHDAYAAGVTIRPANAALLANIRASLAAVDTALRLTIMMFHRVRCNLKRLVTIRTELAAQYAFVEVEDVFVALYACVLANQHYWMATEAIAAGVAGLCVQDILRSANISRNSVIDAATALRTAIRTMVGTDAMVSICNACLLTDAEQVAWHNLYMQDLTSAGYRDACRITRDIFQNGTSNAYPAWTECRVPFISVDNALIRHLSVIATDPASIAAIDGTRTLFRRRMVDITRAAVDRVEMIRRRSAAVQRCTRTVAALQPNGTLLPADAMSLGSLSIREYKMVSTTRKIVQSRYEYTVRLAFLLGAVQLNKMYSVISTQAGSVPAALIEAYRTETFAILDELVQIVVDHLPNCAV
jgi:hypothetical protein